MPVLQLYNTATRRKDPFSPQKPGEVTLYCCGPTVYHFAHIGNLRTYVFEDLLRRTLEALEFQVHHVINITDVGHLTSDADSGEDKMEKGARREGKTVWDIAAYYTEAFRKDFTALRCIEPTHWPRATDHLPEQIALVKKLEDAGYTYTVPQDGIYFDTSKFSRYADFAKLDLEGMQAGARIAVAEGKKSPADFSLWKFSPRDAQRAMEWESPWGKGFPGWHIECSAMAMKLLGETLDIHCGGSDHIRVHHTNEIAQSECATGQPFARYWLHGGWLLEAPEEGAAESVEDEVDTGNLAVNLAQSDAADVDIENTSENTSEITSENSAENNVSSRPVKAKSGGGKMSKSSGEFVTLDVLVAKGYSAMDYRYFCLTAHYRNYLRFGYAALDGARESLRSLRKKTDPLLGKSAALETEKALAWREQFLSAVCDDLNFPQALGVVNLFLKDEDLSDGEKSALIELCEGLLGLGLCEPPAVES
jgi:cysteinyl-tRNA synthetase